ncbi:MAG: hypothetical protein CfP315_0711 [Candidatus Improbicoccus pseudotrichonymphae]|uniref:Uncharacterized protein n=1 Tax=Candidatus Improbicoccus pseudotrichonymphae TaxID=3033792 RepID=A0AA48IH28_9FIRM|nr:MAG: hypothetical protein CfP315_0711 [Candidatus Improbicoccus pseudotrichonymphae]
MKKFILMLLFFVTVLPVFLKADEELNINQEKQNTTENSFAVEDITEVFAEEKKSQENLNREKTNETPQENRKPKIESKTEPNVRNSVLNREQPKENNATFPARADSESGLNTKNIEKNNSEITKKNDEGTDVVVGTNVQQEEKPQTREESDISLPEIKADEIEKFENIFPEKEKKEKKNSIVKGVVAIFLIIAGMSMLIILIINFFNSKNKTMGGNINPKSVGIDENVTENFRDIYKD